MQDFDGPINPKTGVRLVTQANSQEEADAKFQAYLTSGERGVIEGMKPYGYQEKARDFVTKTYPGRMLTEGAVGAGLGAVGGPVGAVMGGIGGAAGAAADKYLEDQGVGLPGRFAGSSAADLVATVIAGRAGIATAVARSLGLRALPSRAQALRLLQDLPVNEGDGAEEIVKALVRRYPELRGIETEAYDAIAATAHGKYQAPFDPIRDAAREGKEILDIGGATPSVMNQAAAVEEGSSIPFEHLDRYRRMINQGRKTAARAGEGETLGKLGDMRKGVQESYQITASQAQDETLMGAIDDALQATARKHEAFPKSGPEYRSTGIHPDPQMRIDNPRQWASQKVFGAGNSETVVNRILGTVDAKNNPQMRQAMRSMALDYVAERRVGAGVEGSLNANAMLGKLTSKEKALRAALGDVEYNNLLKALKRMEARTRPSGQRYVSAMPESKMRDLALSWNGVGAALIGAGALGGGVQGAGAAAITGFLVKRVASRYGTSAADNFALEAVLRPEFRRMLIHAATREQSGEAARSVMRYAVRRGLLGAMDRDEGNPNERVFDSVAREGARIVADFQGE